MTTIVAALAADGTVVFGADTYTWMDDTGFPGVVKAWAHPVRPGDAAAVPDEPQHVLLACAGSGALAAVIRRHWTLGGTPAAGASDDEADAWAGACAEAISEVAVGASPAVIGGDGFVDGSTLLGCGGRIWVVSQQNAVPVYRGSGYAALGSGSPFALGALAVLYRSGRGSMPDTVADKVQRAVLAACQWDAHTRVDDDGPRILRLDRHGHLA